MPVGKKPSSRTTSEHRPISILPAMSKILKLIIKRQMVVHINSFNLLWPFQSGFRAGHSTTTALLKVIDDECLELEEGNGVILVLLDFSKDFDTIDYSRLYR